MNPKVMWALIIVGVMFIISTLFQAFQNRQVRKNADQLTTLLYDQKFKDFYALLEDKKVQRSVPPFNIDFMKLNAAIMQKSPAKIKECLERFEHVRLNNKQKQAVYLNAFNYFVFENNKDQARYCYEKLSTLAFPERGDIERIYNVFVEEKADCLDEVLEEYADAEGDQKYGYLPLLIQLYQNLGDKDKVNEYGQILKDFFDQKQSS
ncbi:MAG: hypothetical protein IJM15_04745 [Erysipelotrichaceae bacterium]|nr:hypothetical protein [Erysipelotrichaceae bacterium]